MERMPQLAAAALPSTAGRACGSALALRASRRRLCRRTVTTAIVGVVVGRILVTVGLRAQASQKRDWVVVVVMRPGRAGGATN